jgi:hypothetical protein
LLLVSFVALAGLLFIAGPADASVDGWTRAINISPQIASDDSRYVAFQRRNAVPVVVDTWTGRSRMISKAKHCQPRDIGAGRVLMICPHKKRTGSDTGFRAKTASVKGGKAAELFKTRKIYDAYEIGRYWVAISTYTSYSSGPVYDAYLNWRTGFIKEMDQYNVKSAIDLNRKAIRWTDVKWFTPRFKGYPNPFFPEPVLCRGKDVVISDWKGQLRLWWDSRRSVRIGRGDLFPDGCSWLESMRIGRNWVTWKNGPVTHGYNFRTGERFDRRFTPGTKITPVRDGVVVARETHRYGKYFKTYMVRFFRLGGRS